MKLQDYLHLYLGCYVAVKGERWVNNGFVGRLIGVTEDRALIEFMGDNWEKFEDFKPILRPLSDMTDDECHEYGVESDSGEFSYGTISSDCTIGGHHHILDITRIAEITRCLCESGFDCFGLIEAGLAIDKTKEAAL
jgi:hypothetical protein